VETRTIGAIGPGDVGATLAVERAGVAEVGYFSKGIRYTLTDGTGNITLLVWQDVLEGMAARFDLFPGSQVRVVGRIDQYQGELEIVPRQGGDVAVISRGERLPVEARPVGQITPSDEGRLFRVEGTVARLEARGYVQLWLNDGSGELLVYLPERLVPYLPPGLAVGVRLRITGEIDIYEGALEIIPLAAADVEVR
jgi:DNA/RNA endonuclease YhcR with UshA esterase domain